MATRGLASLLVAGGVLTPERLAEAQRRREIYGGTLDTVLLELRAVEEPVLSGYLAEAAGLPAPLPERLAEPEVEAAALLPLEEARRMLAVPLGRCGDALELALHPEADRALVGRWAEATRTAVRPCVVPEVRFRELLAAVYGERMSARYGALLGRLIGGEKARRRVQAPAVPSRPIVETAGGRRPPGPAPLEAPGEAAPPAGVQQTEQAAEELGAEPEIDIVEEDTAPGPALETLLLQARNSPDPEETGRAIALLAELRATAAVPVMIDLVTDERRSVAAAARAALVGLTRQDFGDVRRAWLGWWQKAKERHRMEWLLEALGHKRAELRMAAADELQAVTGVYFGYHYDLPERDREQARRRWTEWWKTVGRDRLEGGGS